MKTSTAHQRISHLVVLIVTTSLASSAIAGDAFNFIGPSDWLVGDPLSTAQEWDVFSAALDNQPDVEWITNPPLEDVPRLSALTPGFLSSSANFYAFSGAYPVEATIINHDANVPLGYGTLVRIQVAATLNPDFLEGVILDSLHLLTLDDLAIPGGANDQACGLTLLYSGPAVIGGPFGDVVQEEWLFEFWLPDFASDFKIVMDVQFHGSFLAMRVDTLNAAEPFCLYPDLNCDCRMEFDDALTLFNNLAGPDVVDVPPTGDSAAFDRADGDADLDVDLHDVAEFQLFDQ